MLDINDIIYLILAFSIFTLIIVIIMSTIIKSRQNQNAKALNELTTSIAEIKEVVTTISEKQQINEKAINGLIETLDQHVNVENEAVVVEIAEEPVVKKENGEIRTSRTVELASKVAEYATQIDQLGQIEDPQIRDLKKQLLIFELQEIKREIALIES